MSVVEIIVDLDYSWDAPSVMAAVVFAVPVLDEPNAFVEAVGWVVSLN